LEQTKIVCDIAGAARLPWAMVKEETVQATDSHFGSKSLSIVIVVFLSKLRSYELLAEISQPVAKISQQLE
jgi:hypothetical protein